jgi:hypothetical protein
VSLPLSEALHPGRFSAFTCLRNNFVLNQITEDKRNFIPHKTELTGGNELFPNDNHLKGWMPVKIEDLHLKCNHVFVVFLRNALLQTEKGNLSRKMRTAWEGNFLLDWFCN